MSVLDDTKLSGGNAPVLELWVTVEYLFIAITLRFTLSLSGSTS